MNFFVSKQSLSSVIWLSKFLPLRPGGPRKIDMTPFRSNFVPTTVTLTPRPKYTGQAMVHHLPIYTATASFYSLSHLSRTNEITLLTSLNKPYTIIYNKDNVANRNMFHYKNHVCLYERVHVSTCKGYHQTWTFKKLAVKNFKYLSKEIPTWCHLFYYLFNTHSMLNMFRPLIRPSSGVCD